MQLKKIFTFLTCCTILISPIRAQEAPHHESSAKGAHRITIAMGHAYIHKGLQGEDFGITTPAWAVDYDYWFGTHWAVGLHSDILLENFLVEQHLGVHDDNILEREYPIALVPVVMFKPWNHFSLLAGVGEELAKSEHLLLYRGGLEYGWHLPKSWELGVSFTYDVKRHAYDTWMIGFGLSKFLFNHHHKG